MKYFLAGCAFWGMGGFIVFAVRPGATLSKAVIETVNRKNRSIIALVMVAIILLCTLPMSLNPLWNGEFPGHRNQYEVLAQSILDGHINLDYGDTDPRLSELDNPYDPAARNEAGVYYHWDHAFYNGQYYMYFGVVPVFLLFLPFRIITGASLTTYHATQIFTALFVAGVFALFFLVARKFFSKMVLSVYLLLSAAVSAMSVWYIVTVPALYCTAISAGICMEIWSLFFFVKAVWDSDEERQSTYMGILGSLFGALAFGCRPTIALANILAIPMLVRYLKKKRLNRKLCKQLLAVFAPYIVIGALLMAYNYARFENPFEFGQTYQLTVADQSGYGNPLEQFDLIKVINGLGSNFVGYAPLQDSFPYVSLQSVLFNFPICFAAAVCLLQKDTLSALKRNQLVSFTGVLLFCPILITIFQVLESPYLIERYRSDLYWLMGIFLFLAFGHFLQTLQGRRREICSFIVSLLALATIFRSFILWTIPHDSNLTLEFPQCLHQIERVLRFGF